MNKVCLLLGFMVLTACGNAKFRAISSCSIQGNQLVCTDGTSIDLPEDGAPGRDGSDGAILTEHKVPANKCVKLAEDLYVENIRNGQVYDVYEEPGCNVEATEYCDNVEPSFGGHNPLGPNQPGGAEVCWAGKRMLSGEKVGNDLHIRVITFN